MTGEGLDALLEAVAAALDAERVEEALRIGQEGWPQVRMGL